MTPDPPNDPSAYDSAHATYHAALTSQPVELVEAHTGRILATYPNMLIAMDEVGSVPGKRTTMFLRFQQASAKTASAA